jgi:hypothetical protein
MASSTGCTSVGELAMMLSTSAVPVCCSSASRRSLNSRPFSIAITACFAKLWSSATSVGIKGRTSARATVSAPMGVPSRISGVMTFDR